MNPLVRYLATGATFASSTLLTLAQEYPSSPRIKPWFDTTGLAISFDESLTTSNGRDDLAELFAAIGPVTYTANPTFAPGSGLGRITWPANRTFSEVFRAIQAYTFPADSDITLTNVGLDALGTGWKYPPASALNINGNRIFNLSARAEVGQGEKVTIGGMIIPGDYPRLVAFKVRGASLSAFGISTPLADPKLELYQGSQLILSNDNHTSLRVWETRYATAVCTPPSDAKESMIVTFLDPGPFTAVVSGADGGSGVALLEMYLVEAFLIE